MLQLPISMDKPASAAVFAAVATVWVNWADGGKVRETKERFWVQLLNQTYYVRFKQILANFAEDQKLQNFYIFYS